MQCKPDTEWKKEIVINLCTYHIMIWINENIDKHKIFILESVSICATIEIHKSGYYNTNRSNSFNILVVALLSMWYIL